jgi:hypothetical protein
MKGKIFKPVVARARFHQLSALELSNEKKASHFLLVLQIFHRGENWRIFRAAADYTVSYFYYMSAFRYR